MASFDLTIVTPDLHAERARLVSLEVPAEKGRLTVLAGHQPLVCSLRPGTIRLVVAGGGREAWTIEDGTLRVADGEATILAREARAVEP